MLSVDNMEKEAASLISSMLDVAKMYSFTK